MNQPASSARRRTIGQALMEWGPLVQVYESRLWRRSLVWEALFRLSFEREYALIANAARLKETKCLLDLACGPGIYARRFAAEGAQLSPSVEQGYVEMTVPVSGIPAMAPARR